MLRRGRGRTHPIDQGRTAGGAVRAGELSRPRHISSVVPSPQTTYRSSWPSNDGQLVAQPLHVAAGHLHLVARVQTHRVDRLRTLVVEVPHRDVEDGAGPRRARVDLDRDGAAEQVHVAGHPVDRRRASAWCACTTGCCRRPGRHRTGSRGSRRSSRPGLRTAPSRPRAPWRGRRAGSRRVRAGTAAPPAPAAASCGGARGRPPAVPAAAGPRTRPARRRRAGCSAPASRSESPPRADAQPGPIDRLAAPRRPGAEPLGVVDVGEVLDPAAPEAGPAGPSTSSSSRSALDLVGPHPEQDDVVDDVGIARAARAAR